MEPVTRRGFLKSLGKTAIAGAAVTATTGIKLPKAKRQPKKGERFEIYAAPSGTCLFCNKEMKIEDIIIGTYAGIKNGEHNWIVENDLRCPHCRNKITLYVTADVEFLERETDERPRTTDIERGTPN